MAPKYKNDLAKCYALLKLDFYWKTSCDEFDVFLKALNCITTELVDKEEICPIEDNAAMGDASQMIANFLLDYGCPYPSLTDAPIGDRFATPESRMLLLRYLTTELMAKRCCRKVPVNTPPTRASQASDQAMRESNTELTVCLTRACAALKLPTPVTGFELTGTFGTLGKAASEAIKRCPPYYFGQSILPLTGLSDRQWSQISRIAGLLQQEYASRQATLLKRLDVTVQSFKWSNKAKAQLDAIAAVYNPIRSRMTNSVFPGVVELLAVRDNMILRIEKTSGSSARRYTACPLNKIVIGQVPDRGGRAWELEPPPPEMPGFQQRQPDRGRGGGGGGRGFGGGGRGHDHGDSGRGRGFGRGGARKYARW